ncbi:hypothetical protein RCL1_007312 [Eukaryota sp. TZLM3-RCL]
MSCTDCPICWSRFINPSSLRCGHSFCHECITNWLADNYSCPFCRSVAFSVDIFPNIQLSQLLDDLSQPKVIHTSQLSLVEEFKQTLHSDLSFCNYKGYDAVWKQYRATVNGERIATRQYNLVKSLEFPDNLVRIFGITQNPHGIVIQRMTTSLQDLFDNEHHISFSEALTVAKNITNAVSALHAANFVHRDISAGNVFVNTDSDRRIIGARLGDLDQVKEGNSAVTMAFQGTVAYSAPEVLSLTSLRDSLAAPVDIFSLGVLMHALFSNIDPSRMCESVVEFTYLRSCIDGAALLNIDDVTCSLELKKLIETMISIDPLLRPSIGDVCVFLNQFVLPPTDDVVDISSDSEVDLPDHDEDVLISNDEQDNISITISASDEVDCVRYTLVLINNEHGYETFFGFLDENEDTVYGGICVSQIGIHHVCHGETTQTCLGPPLEPDEVVVVRFSSDAAIFSIDDDVIHEIKYPEDWVFGIRGNNDVVWSTSIVKSSKLSLLTTEGGFDTGHNLGTRVFSVLVSLSIVYLVLLFSGKK